MTDDMAAPASAPSAPAPSAPGPLDGAALDMLFREARTHNKFTSEPVSDETLHALYDILKYGPTSANSSPARFLFLRTKEAKERLAPALSSGNLAKTMAAPVTVIVAYDPKFYERLPFLFPHNPDATVKMITPRIDTIQLIIAECRKMFTTDAMTRPINPMNRNEPMPERSDFVV